MWVRRFGIALGLVKRQGECLVGLDPLGSVLVEVNPDEDYQQTLDRVRTLLTLRHHHK